MFFLLGGGAKIGLDTPMDLSVSYVCVNVFHMCLNEHVICMCM